MPVFRQSVVVEVARNIRAFLKLEAGVTRFTSPRRVRRDGSKGVPALASVPAGNQQFEGDANRARGVTKKQRGGKGARGRQLERTRRLLASKDREIAALRAELDGGSAKASGSVKARTRGAYPDRRDRPENTGVNPRLTHGVLHTLESRPEVSLYLDLMERCLTGWIYASEELRSKEEFVSCPGRILRDEWPVSMHTMVGFARLENIRFCVENTLKDEVPGDLIETGVWRGGATIFMRAILKAYGVTDRTVWVVDSFQGLPQPNPQQYPRDAGDKHYTREDLAVSLEEVKVNFAGYGLLDEQVRFLKGWFRDTLPEAPVEKLAVLRLDGDMYESTMDALTNLYPKLSPGGYLIVDDYGAVPSCRQAVHDYRDSHGIDEEIVSIDWGGVYWRRSFE